MMMMTKNGPRNDLGFRFWGPNLASLLLLLLFRYPRRCKQAGKNRKKRREGGREIEAGVLKMLNLVYFVDKTQSSHMVA